MAYEFFNKIRNKINGNEFNKRVIESLIGKQPEKVNITEEV